MQFDTKLAVVLGEGLAVWQKLNVTAFLVSGIAAADGIVGEPYRDADGRLYRPMIRQPVLVFEAGADALRAAFDRSLERGLTPALFTRDLFATGHDAANRAAVAAVGTAALDLAGFAVHGEKRLVDKALKGLRLHP
ncbi:MAG TPA: DUF2000 family protein [Azospirillaceae bacterium]|nr:DUF2000 family protein [Azospirillaceae bacterium]